MKKYWIIIAAAVIIAIVVGVLAQQAPPEKVVVPAPVPEIKTTETAPVVPPVTPTPVKEQVKTNPAPTPIAKPIGDLTCLDVDIQLVEAKCTKSSFSTPSDVFFDVTAMVKNNGTKAATGFMMSTFNARGTAYTSAQTATVAGGASHWLEPDIAIKDATHISIVPRKGDEICMSKEIRVPIICFD